MCKNLSGQMFNILISNCHTLLYARYKMPLHYCIQDTLSSRTLGLAAAFRPSARASQGIMHTICIITYIISVKIEPRIFASVVSYDRSVELWKFLYARYLCMQDTRRLGILYTMEIQYGRFRTRSTTDIYAAVLCYTSIDQIHNYLLFCWLCFLLVLFLLVSFSHYFKSKLV